MKILTWLLFPFLFLLCLSMDGVAIAPTTGVLGIHGLMDNNPHQIEQSVLREGEIRNVTEKRQALEPTLFAPRIHQRSRYTVRLVLSIIIKTLPAMGLCVLMYFFSSVASILTTSFLGIIIITVLIIISLLIMLVCYRFCTKGFPVFSNGLTPKDTQQICATIVWHVLVSPQHVPDLLKKVAAIDYNHTIMAQLQGMFPMANIPTAYVHPFATQRMADRYSYGFYALQMVIYTVCAILFFVVAPATVYLVLFLLPVGLYLSFIAITIYKTKKTHDYLSQSHLDFLTVLSKLTDASQQPSIVRDTDPALLYKKDNLKYLIVPDYSSLQGDHEELATRHTETVERFRKFLHNRLWTKILLPFIQQGKPDDYTGFVNKNKLEKFLPQRLMGLSGYESILLGLIQDITSPTLNAEGDDAVAFNVITSRSQNKASVAEVLAFFKKLEIYS